ncbi:putative lipoprotein [Leptospira kirschneri str. 200803703]|uniref:Lipoprotein n=1 Tax=Leptospira kirschneri str. 200802841 TaxID=1193047 RepID=A0A828Y1K1_9LEPT|nr:hypothetical protein [Leptospira kirschneri]EKO50781.1 putative lipoprotein [Leptospira kirschneri str. 200802841]EMO68227.1 putative lipoprotein [Leptospira kirschneri str. 200803703]
MRVCFIVAAILFLGCKERVMFSTDDSILYRHLGNGNVKTLGKIYPGFPFLVKTDWISGFEIVDRFLDKELYGEYYFTFARGLVHKNSEVYSYELYYDRGENTIVENKHPYMWVLVFSAKLAFVKIGVIYGKKNEKSFNGAAYWICKSYSKGDAGLGVSNCEKGEKDNSLNTTFVPMFKEVRPSENLNVSCSNFTDSKIHCSFNGSNYVGIKKDKFYIR